MWGSATRVTDRPVNIYREASPPGLAPHETHPVAPEKSLEDPRITRKGDPNIKISSATLKMVAPRGKCLTRSATTPTQIYTDASRESWGAHLGDLTARGP